MSGCAYDASCRTLAKGVLLGMRDKHHSARSSARKPSPLWCQTRAPQCRADATTSSPHNVDVLASQAGRFKTANSIEHVMREQMDGSVDHDVLVTGLRRRIEQLETANAMLRANLLAVTAQLVSVESCGSTPPAGRPQPLAEQALGHAVDQTAAWQQSPTGVESLLGASLLPAVPETPETAEVIVTPIIPTTTEKRPESEGVAVPMLLRQTSCPSDFRRPSPDRGPRPGPSAARARARATSHDEVPMADGTGDGDEQDSWSPVQRLHRFSRYRRHRRASKEGAEGEPPLGPPLSLPSREGLREGEGMGEGRKMEGQDKLV